ncbi:MAG: RecQ family ATP-dependent DNA helicase [Deltaproteobacteria bacterium]|nr:RecQ family ATP-dependent DNA helicase [Deltaproteobacteria bacterium]
MHDHLKKYFGFDSFKKGQQAVINKLLNGESAAAIFPTGAGKSLCYQLPAVLLPAMTLVVSPLLSLMKDQLDFLVAHNIPAARLDSTLGQDEYNRVMQRATSGELKILMISVERFRNERFRYHLQKMKVSMMVVDEAHCISEWGHNFRPEYLKLPFYQNEFKITRTLLLTATATRNVVDDMCQKLNVPFNNVFITGFYRENLFLKVTPTVESGKADQLVKRIKEDIKAPTIVYVTLQKTAEYVAQVLCSNEINAHPYHAGMQNDEREYIQNRFMDGSLDCIVATIAFGMGIDKKNIRRVIHFDLPKSIENYSQEIGRSGRDGGPALCEVLANRESINTLENFVYGDTPEEASIIKILHIIKNNNGFDWLARLYTLSGETNIRVLPLKTLLVYLDMEGIIVPKFTYFDEYYFKYNTEPEFILNQFHGERQVFVGAVLEHCHKKKIWTYLDCEGIINAYKTTRERVMAALEYFNEKKWIELHTKNAVDVYDIKTQDFDAEQLAHRLYHLFKNKERHEIQRIHDMADFFENGSCLSGGLAKYFGEQLEKEKCGHCSFCKGGRATLPALRAQQPLALCDFDALTKEFVSQMQDSFSVLNLTKFLCGIYTPAFSRASIKGMHGYGALENYAFTDVKAWVEGKGGRL